MLKRLLTTSAALLVVAACGESPVDTTLSDRGTVLAAARGGVTAQASGAGIRAEEVGVRAFSFTARNLPDGTTKGEFTLTRSGQQSKYHGAIDCLQVDGNVATMSGYIDHLQFPTGDWGPGDHVWFRVIDNGEPSTEDLMTALHIFFLPGEDAPPYHDGPGTWPSCDETYGPSILGGIDGGNIQVK